MQNDERIAAMLHGNRRNGGGKETPNRPPPAHAASNHSPHQSATSSHHNAKTSTPVKLSIHKRSQKQYQRGHTAIGSRKRKATAPLSQRPARRQRGNATELKDEAYIRSSMHIPTPQEYPDAPAFIFKTPKGTIHNSAQGLAECRTEHILLAKDVHQCTVYYNSAMHNQAVIGEGRTKASH